MSLLENGGRRGYIIYRHCSIEAILINIDIDDFSDRFIDEISLSKTTTNAAKQLGFEKVTEHQRAQRD